MANRTFKVHGVTFSESDSVTLVASVDGTEVSNSAVAKIANTAPELGTYDDAYDNELFSFQNAIPTSGEGKLTISISATGGDALITLVSMDNVPGNADTTAFAWMAEEEGESKTNVTIDGEAQMVPETAGDTHWLVADGQTITFDVRNLVIPA